MKRSTLATLAALAALALLVTVLLVRTARYGRSTPAAPTVAQAGAPRDPGGDVVVDAGAVERLAAAVRVPTVSYFDSATRVAAFQALHALLARSFPLVHARLQREVIDSASLLFTWPGSDPSLQPIVLMGHMDVVPVEAGTEKAWTHGPWSGDVADGFVWGRGTLDDKMSVLATLEAVESLLRRGHAPRRTVILSFGSTEEKGGPSMPHMVARLKARGVRPAFVLDEGGFVTDGLASGVAGSVALVGIAEKGYLSLRLRAHAPGGHSSMPAKETAVGTLAAAITRLERAPMPARLDGATRAMFDRLGPSMPFGRKLVLANLWLFEPVLLEMLSRTPPTDAMIRTTVAPTMLQASPKDNVLPSAASAVVNFRLLPGDSAAAVIRRVKDAIGDSRVTVDVVQGLAIEASSLSPTEGEGWRALAAAIGESFPGTPVSPYLLMGATDSRYYAALTPNVYRFAPIHVTKADIERVHGTNERISAAQYGDGVRFFQRLIASATR